MVQMNNSRYFYYFLALFVTVLIVSNVASSAKIVGLQFPLGITLIFDGGTLLFPVSYIIGDVLTEVYGYKAYKKVIWVGFFALGFSALVFFALSVLPSEAVWDAGGTGSSAYLLILGGMSSGGIVIASLAAFFAGEFSNSALLSKIKVLMKGRLLWVRTITSSLIGEFLDSFIFVGIATLAGVFPKEIFWSLFISNYFLKTLIEIAVTPLTCLVIKKLKKAEGIDVFDYNISYNPFGA